MQRIAFTVYFSWQFIIIAVAIIIGLIGYIFLSDTKYDKVYKEIKKIKKVNIKITRVLIAAVSLVVLAIIIAIILSACGVNEYFGEISIYWYAIFIMTGFLVACTAAYFMAKKKGYNFDLILCLAIVLLPLGIVGARLWFVVFEYESGSHNFVNFWDIIDIRDGGLGIYGGIIFGAIGVVIVSYWQKVNILKLLDIVAPCVLIAQAIGRWGNFVNQEAFGSLVTDPSLQWFPFAVLIGDSWHLATFFYEFLWNTIGFALVYWYCYSKNKIDGIGVCLYFLWYGIGRSWIEPLRTDALFIPGTGIRVSVLFSIIMVVAAVAFGAFLIYYYKKHGRQLIVTKKDKEMAAGANSGGDSVSELSGGDMRDEKNSAKEKNNEQNVSEVNERKKTEDDKTKGN